MLGRIPISGRVNMSQRVSHARHEYKYYNLITNNTTHPIDSVTEYNHNCH